MNFKLNCSLVALMLTGVAFAGEVVREEIAVPYTREFNKEELKSRPGYSFLIKADRLEDFKRMPQERAAAKFSYDDRFFYVTVAMDDSDVVNEAEDNQVKLQNFGDAIQILLKPEKQTYLWEILCAPNRHWSCFFYQGGGRMLPGCEKAGDAKVMVYPIVSGSFNNDADRDTGWYVTVAIPLAELRRNGLKFEDAENWTLMVARYNFSSYLENREISSFPQIVKNVYNPAYFGRLNLRRPAETPPAK